MKKIVIKMRSMKKMVGNDLLKLALMLSLLKVGFVNIHIHGSKCHRASSVFVNKSHVIDVGWVKNNNQRE